MFTENFRPTKLHQLKGQDAARRLLTGWLKAYKETGTSDAFLITGPTGTGKTSVAHVLAGELGCTFGFETVLASECKVDTVRQLGERLQKGVLGDSRWVVILIDEAHTMTPPARDAFLSLLENLPPFRVVCFTTTEPQVFSGIWQSRCKKIHLQAHTIDTTTEIMKGISQQSNRTPAPSVLQELATRAAGNARQAIQTLETYLLSTTAEDDDNASMIDELFGRVPVEPLQLCPKNPKASEAARKAAETRRRNAALKARVA